MPTSSIAAPGVPLSAARATAARLVIFERPVLCGAAPAVDERPAPPAEASAEALTAAARLAHAGYHLAIASHHPAVARGLLEMTTVNGQNRRLLRQLDEAGARVEAIAICPHAPDAGCSCRMPQPGMLLELIGRFNAGPATTAVIAASYEAVEAARAAGCRPLWITAEDDAAALASLTDAVDRLMAGDSAEAAPDTAAG